MAPFSNPPIHRRHHVLALLGLFCLGALVQGVVIGRAVVPSRDAVRFVEMAQTVQRQGVVALLHAEAEQPLFPVWLAVVHEAIAWLTGDFPAIWATSAQVAAAVPLVLTLLPLYLMLLRLFDIRIAVVGSILFCVLPEVRRLGADGISDGMNLLLFTAALWATVEYWTYGTGGAARARIGWLALAGVLSGLALLTRAEAIVLPVALALSLGAVCAARRSMPVLRATAAHAAGYVLGLAIVLGPFVVLSGAHAPQAVVARVLGRGGTTLSAAIDTPVDDSLWQTPDGRPLRFAAKEGSIRRCGHVAALLQYAEELADVFGYWLGPVALWALWRRRRELARPVDRFLQTFFVVFSVVLILFVSTEGYLSARHLLPLLVAGLGIAALGAWDVGILLERFATRLGVCAVMVLVVGVYLVSASCPLHGSRLAHRLAGSWLARESPAGAVVLDTRGWTALYSARPTYPYNKAKTALCDRRLGYVVVERRELQYDSDRARTLRYLLAAAGRRVARFESPEGDAGGAVDVYRWHGERFLQAMRPDRATRLARSATSQAERVRR